MSREIKVRAWDTLQEMYMKRVYRGEEPRFDEDGIYEIDAPSYWVLEQFTGLRDSQDQDIYEGDIITFQRWDDDTVLRGPVWWDAEAAAWAFGRYTHQHCDEPFDWGYSASKIREGSMRVVGNVHEESVV